MESPSWSTTYQRRKKQVNTQKDSMDLYTIYLREIVHKCFIDREFLIANNTCAIKASCQDAKYKDMSIMCLLASMHKLQTQSACMHIFNLVGLGQLFQMKPCGVDAL